MSTTQARSRVALAAFFIVCLVATPPASGASGATAEIATSATVTQRAQRLDVDATKPIFPMQTTPRCDVLDNFGDPRSGGRTHEGTDMLATLGQEVYAVVDGTLGHQVKVGDANADLSGNAWRLTVAGGTTWYVYMHLSAFAPGLANGSVVTQGQLIGFVGDTGNPGPGNYHLHFEVHPNGGAAVNALTVLTVPPACTVT